MAVLNGRRPISASMTILGPRYTIEGGGAGLVSLMSGRSCHIDLRLGLKLGTWRLEGFGKRASRRSGSWVLTRCMRGARIDCRVVRFVSGCVLERALMKAVRDGLAMWTGLDRSTGRTG
ncbi:unnamed protein product [Linum trigynum]|uniref:Uncharacterized protein n=1 Tax=Linum trigynum TaxID=586398 RepID=A0AAV2FSY8_9ROSI